MVNEKRKEENSMDGVIVLDSWTNTTEPDISSLLLTIIIILLLLCFLALDKRGWPILLIGIIFYIWAFSVDLQDKFGTPAEESIYYKIKLEEGIDAKEFLEKYRIIDSNGDIYIIEEREE